MKLTLRGDVYCDDGGEGLIRGGDVLCGCGGGGGGGGGCRDDLLPLPVLKHHQLLLVLPRI